MVLSNAADANTNQNPIDIRLEGSAPTLICQLCGRTYTSSGKHDSGYCPDCLRQLLFGFYYGGPLDGQKTAEDSKN